MSSKFYCSWSPLGKAAFNIAVAGLVGFVFFFFLKKNYFFFNLYEYGVYCLTELIANSVKLVLNLFGFNCLTFGKIISNTDGVSLILDRGCVGRNVLLVFMAFIIATPAEVWRKFAYIAAGLAVIVLLNVLRISLLMYVASLQLFYSKIAEICLILDANQAFVFAHSSQIGLFDTFGELQSSLFHHPSSIFPSSITHQYVTHLACGSSSYILSSRQSFFLWQSSQNL